MSVERPLTRSAGEVASVIGGSLRGDPSVMVGGVRHDSRQVEPGDVFCCMKGAVHDGHDHAAGAVARGASCLVVERVIEGVAPEVPQVSVPDVRAVLGRLASWMYGNPSQSLRVVGVTGTNGKTTTAAILASILREAGLETSTLGTLSGARTTPEADDLQRTMRQMVDDGVEALVMEVSSHALDLGRVDGTRFERAVFTNLSRDHLDHHGDMESYFGAKAKLFSAALADAAVINTDDEWGQRLARDTTLEVSRFSLDDVADVFVGVESVSFTWRGRHVSVPIGGRFTVSNALAALSTAASMGVDLDVALRGCGSVSPVSGRFQSIANDAGFHVVVDYAHTPESLAGVIATAREICAGRVIVVFGCGGGRDQGKRRLMGRAAATADHVVVTSDNPRSEDPGAIIADVAAGVTEAGGELQTQPDRALAIASAISEARRGDIVVIAGKGHESTQEIAGVFHPFVDADVAAAALESRKGDIA